MKDHKDWSRETWLLYLMMMVQSAREQGWVGTERNFRRQLEKELGA